jgi:hypothetical protein
LFETVEAVGLSTARAGIAVTAKTDTVITVAKRTDNNFFIIQHLNNDLTYNNLN